MKYLLVLFAAIISFTNFTFSQVKPAETVWTEFVSQEGGFKISFPGKPKTEKDETKVPGGVIKHTRTSLTLEGVGFMVMWSDSPNTPIRTEKELKERYDKLRDMMVLKPGRNLVFDRDARSGDKRGRDFAFSTPTEIAIVKVFAVGDRLYQAIATLKISGKEDKAGLDRTVKFFDSFSLISN